MSSERPQDHSIQEWLASIDHQLEGLNETLERIAGTLEGQGKGLPPERDEIHYADGRVRPLSDAIPMGASGTSVTDAWHMIPDSDHPDGFLTITNPNLIREGRLPYAKRVED